MACEATGRRPAQLSIGPVAIPYDQMIAFAQRYDPQPFHLDEHAAATTLLGGLAASAWYTCAKLSDDLQRTLARLETGLWLGGVEHIVLLSPVRGGDELSGILTFGGGSPCDCGMSAAGARLDVANQRGDIVMRMMLELVQSPQQSSRTDFDSDCRLHVGRAARVSRASRPDAIRHFEDITIGDEIELGRHTFTRETVEAFYNSTAAFIPVPQAAYDVSHEVPAWLLPAAWMRQMVTYYEEECARRAAAAAPIPQLGPAAGVKELRWHRPVMIGETINFRGWAERKIEIGTMKSWGLLVIGAEGVAADGNVVISFYPQMLIERRQS